MTLLITGLFTGAAAGLLGVLLGVGGGILMVPAFVYFLKMDFKAAAATSLAVMLATAAIATWRYGKSGMIDWRLAGVAALGAVIGAYYGTDLMKQLSSNTLKQIFGVFMILMGIRMLISSPSSPQTPHPQEPALSPAATLEDSPAASPTSDSHQNPAR